MCAAAAHLPQDNPSEAEGDVFLFSDLVGSTPMSMAPGADRFVAAMNLFNSGMEATIREAGGIPIRGDGDCWKGLFSDVSIAVDGARAIQQESLKWNWQDAEGVPRKMRVRIGIHHLGTATTLDPDRMLANYREIAFARRVMDQADAEQILVSRAAYERLEGSANPVDWMAHPPVLLKGIPGPHHLIERLWDGVSRGAPGARWLPDWLKRVTNQFVGRESHLIQIGEWMEGIRASLILHGFGGVGKTRLAGQALAAAADRFDGRVFAVSLEDVVLLSAATSSPETAGVVRLRALAGEIGRAVFGTNYEATNPDIDLLTRLNDGSDRLLLLDNWESVHSREATEWLALLLSTARRLRCIVTSRNAFQMGTESVSLEIFGLEIPKRSSRPLYEQEGYRLFKARVDQHHPPKEIHDVASLTRILNLTEGFAFAIELTAAQRQVRTLKQIADGLDLSLLDNQSEAATPGLYSGAAHRHRAMDACIEWSVDSLPPDDRELFPLTSLFPGDFLPDAAFAVARIPDSALLRWRTAHLIEADETRQPGEVRYSILPVVREWAKRHVSKRKLTGAERRFFSHYAKMAAGFNKTGLTEIAALSCELHNFRTAVLFQGKSSEESAAALVCLGSALQEIPVGDRDQNLRLTIACNEAAMRVYSEAGYPHEWAATQNNLGVAYRNLPSGHRDQNLLHAISCYKSAMRVYTEQTFPEGWAAAQNNLALAYSELPTGDRDENLREAVACYVNALRVFSEEQHSQDWAMAQNNLGIVYASLTSGDREKNLRRAIACYEAALRVRSEQSLPKSWAATQNNLGLAYSGLLSAGRDESLLKAISCYEAALRVYDEAAFPREWAMTQNNLGSAYRNLPSGNRTENLNKAIACYESALRVYAEMASPVECGHAHVCLGNAYLELGDYAEARAHFRVAAASYAAAGLPEDWEWRAYAEERMW